jgi:hypothetical protein
MSRLEWALVAGAITLGIVVVGSLCPTILGGGSHERLLQANRIFGFCLLGARSDRHRDPARVLTAPA